jgi:hypothetical protein
MNSNVRKSVAGRHEHIVGACDMRILGLFVHRFPPDTLIRYLPWSSHSPLAHGPFFLILILFCSVPTLFSHRVITYKCLDGHSCSALWRLCALVRPGVATAPQSDLCLAMSPRFFFFSFLSCRSSSLTPPWPARSHPSRFVAIGCLQRGWQCSSLDLFPPPSRYTILSSPTCFTRS